MRSIPFSSKRTSSTKELPLILVRYLVVFPVFTLTVVNLEPWIEASGLYLLLTGLGLPALMWFFHGCAIWNCGDGCRRVSNFSRSWA